MADANYKLTHAPHSREPVLHTVVASIARPSATVPLCHMEYVEKPDSSWGWSKMSQLSSPSLPVRLKLHTEIYVQLGLQQPSRKPRKRQEGSQEASNQAIADMGAQMDICSIAVMHQLGIDPTSLVPVKVRIFGTSRGARIEIVGSLILEILDPSGHAVKLRMALAVHLFYVAANVSSTYLSLANLKALGVVKPAFPRFGTASSTRLATSYSSPLDAKTASSQSTGKATVGLPPCQNIGVVLEGDKPCSCTRYNLSATTPIALQCAAMRRTCQSSRGFCWTTTPSPHSTSASTMMQSIPLPEAVGRPIGHANLCPHPIHGSPPLAAGHAGGPQQGSQAGRPEEGAPQHPGEVAEQDAHHHEA